MKIVDTLVFARRLHDAGVPREQAEAHAAVMAEMVLSEVATKADLALLRDDIDRKLVEIRKDLDRVRDQLTIRLGAILVVGLTALATLQKIL